MVSILTQNEQASRGQELLNMLWQPVAPATGDVDVEVVVKGTFISVVDPRCKRSMKRSMSDSELLHMASEAVQSWTLSADKTGKIQDLISDASTTVSNDDSSEQDGDASVFEGRDRMNTCWSDAEGMMENVLPPYLPCGYVDSWWMPVTYDPDAAGWMAMDGSYMSPWVDGEGELVDPDAEWRTTVMLRNMPNNYTREMLLELVDALGFEACYDFVYLPIDFKSQAGLGYAFINFVSSAEAQRCFEDFEGFNDWKVPSEKVCTVTWGSPYQGLEAHIDRYQNSPVMHHSIPDEWKPALFHQAQRVDFPAPTKPIKTPKVRQVPGSN